MSGPHVERMWAHIAEAQPRALQGVKEAHAEAPELFDEIAETYLTWGEATLGDEAIPHMISSFVRFTTDANISQHRYERDGHYEYSTFAECLENVYLQRDEMYDYLWGVYLANCLWAHHLELMRNFDERFLARLEPETRFIELGSGHGGWGAWALHRLPKATLHGYDISPTSMEIANQVAEAAGFNGRATYSLHDALDLTSLPAASANAVISGFLLEHLEQPGRLFEVIAHVLETHGYAFVTAALTAAQHDHIYEFFRESEVIVLAEEQGLRVREFTCSNPRRTLRNAKYLARTASLVVQKRAGDHW